MSEDTIDGMEQEEKRRDIKGLIMFGVSAVVLSVVGFCEVLYVKMMLTAFPDGIIQLVAISGACATGASAILLLAGKLHWFSRGKQSYAAWAFVGVEVFILALNVILAVQLHNGHVTDWMQWWEGFYPAAPIVAFVGWGLILYLDKDNIMRSIRRDQKERQEKSELEYQALVHQTKMKVQHQSLQIIADKLEAKIATDAHMAALDKVADAISNVILGEISGQHITSLRAPQSEKTIEGSLAQTSSTPVPIDTTGLDTDMYTSLLDKAVQYGQISEEEADPLRQALGKTQAKHQSNGSK